MKNVLSLMLFFLVFASACSASAATQIIKISVAPARDGIKVSYIFSAPRKRLYLGAKIPSSLNSNIHIKDKFFTFRNGVITSKRYFSSVEILLSSDNKEVDSVYPLMTYVIGRGYVIYAPYIMPYKYIGNLTVKDYYGKIIIYHKNQLNGYFLISTEVDKRDTFNAVFSNNSPSELTAEILARAEKILKYYKLEMGRTVKNKPIIIMSYMPNLASKLKWRYRGDATPNGVVFLRIYSIFDPKNESLRSEYTTFLSHELFHLWNHNETPNLRAWWLHEGGADYASWLATATLWPAEVSLTAKLSTALNACALAIASSPMNQVSDQAAREARYPCGAIIAWIADLGVRSEGRGQTIFAVWAHLFDYKSRQIYAPDNFLAEVSLLGQRAVPVEGLILNDGGIARWSKIATMMNVMGAQVQLQSPRPFMLRAMAAQALVKSACGTVDGVGENSRGLYVQAPQYCSIFNREPVIKLAAGQDPLISAQKFFNAVQTGCAISAEIPVMLDFGNSNEMISVRCTVDVTAPSQEFLVTKALPTFGSFNMIN